MRAGRVFAAAQGVVVQRDEAVVPLGTGWLIRDRKGFTPCPWAFSLAKFAPARPGDRVLDLGCGTGILLWALQQVHPQLGALVGLELDPRSVHQAARTARFIDHPALIARGDVCTRPFAPRAYDLIVANPPFYPAGWGRQSSTHRTARATHALHGDVSAFTAAAAHGLAPHGRVVFVYDAGHLTALLLAFKSAGLTVRTLRFLDDERGRPARVLVLAGLDGGGLSVERDNG